MKKILVLISCFFLISGFALPIKANTSSIEGKVYIEEVRQRFEDINSRYEINEPFSEEDAQFIKNNAIYQEEQNVFVPKINNLLDSGTENISPFDLTIYSDGYWGERGYIGTGCGVRFTYGADYRLTTSFVGNGAAIYTSGVRLVFHSNASTVKEVLLGTKLTTYGLIGNSGTYVGITSSTTKTKKFAGGSSNYYALLSNTNYILLTAWAYGNSWVEVDTKNCSTTKSVF